MSIERLIHCRCGHIVDHHEAGGCRSRVRVAAVESPCDCVMNRVEAIDSIVEVERTAIHDRWRNLESTAKA